MTLREALLGLCHKHLDTIIHHAGQLIAEARDTVANETKSSAGDKYETTREMMQQDINMNLARIHEAKKQKQAILSINTTTTTPGIILPGCVVFTNRGNFYIAVSAGKLTCQGDVFTAISIASPLGAQMKGLKAGDTFFFNNLPYHIERIA